MRRFLGIALILLSAPPAVLADCRVQSSSPRPHLVELYTSSGCNSCPPAERWMSTLRKHPDLVGLEFHVDYWDTAEWHDPFSDHAYMLRQQVIAKRRNKDQIYTPQIWLDGRVWVNWPAGAPPEPAGDEAPIMELALDASDTVHVAVDVGSAGSKPDYRVYAALAETGLSEYVRAGENRGKSLSFDEVVRAFAGPFELPHAEFELKPPPRAKREHTSVVAFVQDEASGDIVQAVRAPLQGCAK
ncbi:MAG TPA: DUF1223 domain-containing protein [Rudaea sp.]|jgi:hypothetical protein|nr:DUF1223 domain-containing protein [Rudaea sp.]